MTIQSPWLITSEAIEYARTSRTTFAQMKEQGLPSYGTARKPLFLAEDIDDFYKARPVKDKFDVEKILEKHKPGRGAKNRI